MAAAAAVLVPPALAAKPRLPRRPLGQTGVAVPILGLGTVAVGNQVDQKEAVALIHKAIDLGVTYIDTAPPRAREKAVRNVRKRFLTPFGSPASVLAG